MPGENTTDKMQKDKNGFHTNSTSVQTSPLLNLPNIFLITLRFLVYGERERRESVCVCVCVCLSQGAKQQLEHERQLKREAFHQVDDLLTQVHSGYCLVMNSDLIS